MESARDRYRNDMEYRALVDMMIAMIHRCEFTPSEMREAAVLASIEYDAVNIRRRVIPLTPELHEQLKELDAIVSSPQ